MKKLKSGKDLGLSLSDCISLMNKYVSHYKSAGKKIYHKGYYRRGRSYNPIEGKNGHVDIYYLNQNGDIETLCFNTSYHRSNVLLRSLLNGSINNVDCNILDNYITNGFNTRLGLFRSNKRLNRIKQLAKSHSDYLGNESGNSKYDHYQRVRLRN